MTTPGDTDPTRARLAQALPHALMPVGAQLRWRDTDELTGYGEFLLAALTPVVEDLRREAAAEALAAAREYAREACRIGFAEDRGPEFTRHWAAIAGWLRHRREQIIARQEPDWPDAAEFRTQVSA